MNDCMCTHFICAYMYTGCILRYTRVHICTHTHIHVYIYIYIHTLYMCVNIYIISSLLSPERTLLSHNTAKTFQRHFFGTRKQVREVTIMKVMQISEPDHKVGLVLVGMFWDEGSAGISPLSRVSTPQFPFPVLGTSFRSLSPAAANEDGPPIWMVRESPFS